MGNLATEIVHQIDQDFVQLREQFLNLIVGCLMRIIISNCPSGSCLFGSPNLTFV